MLVIGQYLDQLESITQRFAAPVITGKTPQREREQIYEAFRTGKIKRLIVSKVANFSIDLPDANVAIQVSGTFGSRQEEAQRLGRILRPKSDGSIAHFYALVTKESQRPGVRHPPSTVPDRARLPLRNHRRRNPPGTDRDNRLKRNSEFYHPLR